MSTFKMLLMASLTATSLINHTGVARQGGGGGNVKLTGPGLIAPSRNHVALDGTYTYTVTLPQAVGVNTVVEVSDETSAAEPTVYSITIPPGQTVGYFEVFANFSGADTLRVDTVNSGYAELPVTVL